MMNLEDTAAAYVTCMDAFIALTELGARGPLTMKASARTVRYYFAKLSYEYVSHGLVLIFSTQGANCEAVALSALATLRLIVLTWIICPIAPIYEISSPISYHNEHLK